MTTERLESDPARQATDTIRGYVYQFYQSVLAWITLDEDEILFLEGAEDFDIYHNQDVQTVQVKDTKKSGSFTLNHHEATKALNNFWQHKQSNPEYKINFRFLTTSPIGKERNAKFGQNTNGIDYWQMVKEGLADVG
ncbi:MAG: dsDNA nuclease domain-containing protein, partial [Nitrospinota bacterium]